MLKGVFHEKNQHYGRSKSFLYSLLNHTLYFSLSLFIYVHALKLYNYAVLNFHLQWDALLDVFLQHKALLISHLRNSVN